MIACKEEREAECEIGRKVGKWEEGKQNSGGGKGVSEEGRESNDEGRQESREERQGGKRGETKLQDKKLTNQKPVRLLCLSSP